MSISHARGLLRALLAVSAVAGFAGLAAADTVVALRDANQLVFFDAATPGNATAVDVTGLAPGESLVGIDVRPKDRRLYGITDQGRIYLIGPTTGETVLVSTSSVALQGTLFGVDFNPVVDRMRVVSDQNQNLRIDVTTGAATADTPLAYAALDDNEGADPAVSANAYTNSAAGVATTKLYVIDPATDVLAIQNPPNNGTLSTVGPLGVDAASSSGLDISPAGNTAYAALGVGGSTGLYKIDLATGAATLVGAIGDGTNILEITVAPPDAPPLAKLVGVTDTKNLVLFTSTDPASATVVGPITGMQDNESVMGLDFRPADLSLYAIGGNGFLYRIDTATAAATQVAPLSAALQGVAFGADFNPVVDRLRVVSDGNKNIRIDPSTGVVATDADVAYAVADAHEGKDPAIVALAYTNSFAGATATTLYAIDEDFDSLAIQNPPNAGTLTTVGPLGFDAGALSALDIEDDGNAAFAALTPDAGTTNFCSVDLATGRATLVGPVGAGLTLRAMAIVPSRTLDVDHSILHFDYRKPGKDKFTVRGTVPALEGETTGVVVTADIGGATQSFTLDRKGRSREGSDTFALVGKPRNGRIAFELQLKKGDFAGALADEGLDGTADAKKEPRSVIMRVRVGADLHQTVVVLSYTAKTGKTGIAKSGPDTAVDGD